MAPKPPKPKPKESIRYYPEDKKEKACTSHTVSGDPCRSNGPFYTDDDSIVRCRAHSSCPEAVSFRSNFVKAGKIEGLKQKNIPWALRSNTLRNSPHGPPQAAPNVVGLSEAAAKLQSKSYWPANPDTESPAGIRTCIKAVAQNCAAGIWDDRRCRAMNDTLKTALNALDDRNEHVKTPTEKLLLELVQKA